MTGASLGSLASLHQHSRAHGSWARCHGLGFWSTSVSSRRVALSSLIKFAREGEAIRTPTGCYQRVQGSLHPVGQATAWASQVPTGKDLGERVRHGHAWGASLLLSERPFVSSLPLVGRVGDGSSFSVSTCSSSPLGCNWRPVSLPYHQLRLHPARKSLFC